MAGSRHAAGLPLFSDREILEARGPRNDVTAARPYAWLVEPECTADGSVEDVATVFLTNRECPFRCLMCDLWQNTLQQRVAAGDIARQIDWALSQLPSARHIKLYNSGNFFDTQAIPRDDLPQIAERVADFETVIVENHPKLCGPACARFGEMIDGQFEVAMGLETVHPQVLPRLNKQMTLDDFRRAAEFLRERDINVRAFILLRPPSLTEEEGLEWALRSLEFAFDAGVGCCAVIPTRAGNGMMEQLETSGLFQAPDIKSLERVVAEGLAMSRGRVFGDLWDAERFCGCQECGPQRVERLRTMNLTQTTPEPVDCSCAAGSH